MSGDALPAVTVPSAWKAGRSRASDSSEASARGPSSDEIVSGSPLRWGTTTDVSSAANFPLPWAATARWCERRANSSWSSRETSYFAVSPIWSVPYISASFGLTRRQPSAVS